VTARVLRSDRSFQFQGSVFSPIVSLGNFPDWASWVGAKSKNFRHEIGKYRRRLSGVGKLRSMKAGDTIDADAVVAWLFETKRQWLADRGIRKSWIIGPEAETLFSKLLARPTAPGHDQDFHGFALTLDDKIIAAGFCFLSPGLLEFHMTGFDPEFAYYSPGNLLIEDIATWAIQRRADLDFRLTQTAYKARWADREQRYDSFTLACSPLGVPAIARKHADHWVRSARKAVGPRLKALRKSLDKKPKAAA
jgi:CelD/BcsL family acetyltransferase involved in cellulose biosynthesis